MEPTFRNCSFWIHLGERSFKNVGRQMTTRNSSQLHCSPSKQNRIKSALTRSNAHSRSFGTCRFPVPLLPSEMVDSTWSHIVTADFRRTTQLLLRSRIASKRCSVRKASFDEETRGSTLREATLRRLPRFRSRASPRPVHSLESVHESWIPRLKQTQFTRFELYDLKTDPAQKQTSRFANR